MENFSRDVGSVLPGVLGKEGKEEEKPSSLAAPGQSLDDSGLPYSLLAATPGLGEHGAASRLYLVDEVGSELFEEAISRLMAVSRVGVSWRGERVGRAGLLCLLVLATHRDVFIFDLLLLGREGFQYGLWAVLRRPELVKVVHDVRQLSDVLYHQYDLVLENVFDTLAAHLVVANWAVAPQRDTAAAPRLSDLLATYLGVALPRSSVQEAQWRGRALPPALLVTAALPCVFLPPLSLVLERELGRPVEGAVAALLQEVRGMEDEEAEQALLAPHITPDSMVVTLPPWRREGPH